MTKVKGQPQAIRGKALSSMTNVKGRPQIVSHKKQAISRTVSCKS
jgi:hypothetical protein